MSAVESRAPTTDASKGVTTFSFEQSIPIPSYLIALAVGELKGVEVGPPLCHRQGKRFGGEGFVLDEPGHCNSADSGDHRQLVDKTHGFPLARGNQKPETTLRRGPVRQEHCCLGASVRHPLDIHGATMKLISVGYLWPVMPSTPQNHVL